MARYYIDLTKDAEEQLKAAGIFETCKEWAVAVPYLRSRYTTDGKVIEVDIDAMTHDDGKYRIKLSYLSEMKKVAVAVKEKK